MIYFYSRIHTEGEKKIVALGFDPDPGFFLTNRLRIRSISGRIRGSLPESVDPSLLLLVEHLELLGKDPHLPLNLLLLYLI